MRVRGSAENSDARDGRPSNESNALSDKSRTFLTFRKVDRLPTRAMSANDSQGIGTRVCSLIENVFASSVDSGFDPEFPRHVFFPTNDSVDKHLKAAFRSCLEETRVFPTIPTHTLGRHRDRTRKGGRPWLAPHSRRGVGTAPHRREAAPVEMGEVRGARAEASPRYARARSHGARAPRPARRVSALLRSRDGGVRRARISLEAYLSRHR